jgi:hypothetical protein
MPSSTSNSETGRRGDAGRVELRTAIAGLLLLVGGLLFARCNIEILDVVQPEKKRLREAIEALPAISSYPQPTAIVFGSSLVWNGFVPEIFDDVLAGHGIDLASFNLGFGGLNPEIQRVLAQRVRRAHQAAGRRIKLAVIEFNPFQTTSVRASRDALVRDQHLMMLATPTQIAALALQSPQRAARYFSGHFFRKSLSAETVTGSFGFIAAGVGEVFDPADPNAAKPSAEMQAVLDRREQAVIDSLFGLVRAHSGVPPMWEFDFRGKMRMEFPETRDSLEVSLVPNDWDQRDDLDMRIRCCDIEELRLDPDLVEDFIALVAEFSAFADTVEVILMPVNHAWVVRSAAGEQRLRAAIERIEREARVRVADFQAIPKIDPEQFFDVTHLSPLTGARVFSAHLGEHYARVLAPTPRP